MFKAIEIKTFQLEDLANKTLEIKSYSDADVELIIGKDIKTKELYLLKEINHNIEEEGR